MRAIAMVGLIALAGCASHQPKSPPVVRAVGAGVTEDLRAPVGAAGAVIAAAGSVDQAGSQEPTAKVKVRK